MIHAAGNDTSVNVAGSSFEDSTSTLICYNLKWFSIDFVLLCKYEKEKRKEKNKEWKNEIEMFIQGCFYTLLVN